MVACSRLDVWKPTTKRVRDAYLWVRH